MKRLLTGAAVATLLSFVSPALSDSLHGYCTGCVDNGTNTPIGTATNFGFLVDPGPQNAGSYQMVLLIPNDFTFGSIPNFQLTGNQGANIITALSNSFIGNWTGGNLDTFLGISAQPNNPLGAYLPSAQAAGNPTATGFFVFDFNLGQQTLFQDTTSALFNLSAQLETGAFIVAFLEPNGVATANSAALFVNPLVSPVPLPGAVALLGPVLGIGYLGLRRRKKKEAARLALAA